MSTEVRKFVSRAGEKLQGSLEGFHLDVRGLTCADFGCNVGGFTDCLLQNGAEKVYAIDTGYGELAWRLRNDSRVVVMERTNALYCELDEPVDLVTIDVAWTPQELIVPAAMKQLREGGAIISLLKPHYELGKLTGRSPHARLTLREGRDVVRTVCERLGSLGCTVRAGMQSALLGKGGNMEFILLLGATGFGR